MTNNNKEKLTTSKTIKTILFAGLLAAMILPFSAMDVAEAQIDQKNPRDKTSERMQEKEARELISKKINALGHEYNDLKEKIKHESDKNEQDKINKRVNEIKTKMNKIERDNHKKDIPQAQMEKLISQQESFEEKLLDSSVFEFVTSVGIDITSKEIQIGIDQDRVNSDNIDSVVADLEQMVPNNAKWHVVYSDRAELLSHSSCTQKECNPLIGGNYIKVSGMSPCSVGFKAMKGTTEGWITAGHCADGKVDSSVTDYSSQYAGIVKAEKFYWGTSCDCAWIEGDYVDPDVFGFGTTHPITKTTQASQQQNDTIMKSGQAGGLDFGTVSAINVTVYEPFTSPPQYIKNLVRSDTNMDHGDSGGSIVESGDREDLYGIVATHDSWGQYHTPIDQITAHMGVSVVLN